MVAGTWRGWGRGVLAELSSQDSRSSGQRMRAEVIASYDYVINEHSLCSPPGLWGLPIEERHGFLPWGPSQALAQSGDRNICERGAGVLLEERGCVLPASPPPPPALAPASAKSLRSTPLVLPTPASSCPKSPCLLFSSLKSPQWTLPPAAHPPRSRLFLPRGELAGGPLQPWPGLAIANWAPPPGRGGGGWGVA